MIKTLHRLVACVLAFFLLLHFANHLFLIVSIETHLDVLHRLRAIYRSPVIEAIILASFMVQIALGLVLAWNRRRPDSRWAALQLASGLYLGFFLVQHIGAVLMARASGIESDSYFAAAVVNREGAKWYFAPYYALGIAAVFGHLAAALRFRRWPEPATLLQRSMPIFGLVFGILVVGGLMGAFDEVRIPAANSEYLDSMFGK
jgi:succinate dehydrogenase/fumarate reductase cytochrome b subunit